MIRLLSLVSSLMMAMAAFADIAIHSVTPSSGPASGGTEVTIHGSGFDGSCGPITCPLPLVLFGTVPAVETRVVNETTVVAVTPAHFPEVVYVRYEQQLQETVLLNAFTFTGEAPDSFTRVLLPILAPPVRGAFGSEFHTNLTLATKRFEIHAWGLKVDFPCPILCPELDNPLVLEPNGVIDPELFRYTGNPGRFFYVRSFDLRSLAANLRVHDVTRAALNFGTEIPVVRPDEFATRILLNGVPADPRFRLTLRIYGIDAPFARVTANGQTVTVPLRQGETIFDPDYAELTLDQPEAGPFQVIVDAPVPPTIPPQPIVETPVWAFITVTNNETQVISTITPQP
ncbi:MAG TPA: IPT/TIG domain-containing protein [Thermoanaerobaculia bacterium]|nr:IPT/TIG domain-containing protein [Thermoanaerobaculia bacterium]